MSINALFISYLLLCFEVSEFSEEFSLWRKLSRLQEMKETEEFLHSVLKRSTGQQHLVFLWEITEDNRIRVEIGGVKGGAQVDHAEKMKNIERLNLLQNKYQCAAGFLLGIRFSRKKKHFTRILGWLTRSIIFKLSNSLQLRFLRRWASSMITQRQEISLSSGQSDNIISKVVIKASNLYAPGIKWSCRDKKNRYYSCISRSRTDHQQSSFINPPSHPCSTSHTAGSSADWPGCRGRQWRSCWSRWRTPSPSLWWWKGERWQGTGLGHQQRISQRAVWWTGWSYPDPSHLPGYSSA